MPRRTHRDRTGVIRLHEADGSLCGERRLPRRTDCDKVNKELQIVKNKTKKVSENCAEDLKEPFASKMAEFIISAEVQLKDLRSKTLAVQRRNH